MPQFLHSTHITLGKVIHESSFWNMQKIHDNHMSVLTRRSYFIPLPGLPEAAGFHIHIRFMDSYFQLPTQSLPVGSREPSQERS